MQRDLGLRACLDIRERRAKPPEVKNYHFNSVYKSYSFEYDLKVYTVMVLHPQMKKKEKKRSCFTYDSQSSHRY